MVLRATDMSHGYQQSKEERYTAELVNQSGETLQNFAVDVKRSRNGKRVELSIRDSIPAALLGKGSYLRLSYPLSANGSAVLLQQPNLRGDGEAVSFQSGQTALAVSGVRYQYDAMPQVFRTGLACLLYRSVEEREDGKYTANLYLTPQNSVFLSRMPEELSLAREQLNGLKKLGEAEPGNDGVEVLYRYTTQFQATEASTARDGLELQCQLRLLYPTQIRITESDKTEMTQDVSQEFTTEAQTTEAQTTTQATTAPTSAARTTAAQSETVTEAESSRRAESQSSTAHCHADRDTDGQSKTGSDRERSGRDHGGERQRGREQHGDGDQEAQRPLYHEAGRHPSSRRQTGDLGKRHLARKTDRESDQAGGEFVLGTDDTGIDAGKYGCADAGEHDLAGDGDDCDDRGADDGRADHSCADGHIRGRHLGPAAESERQLARRLE